MKIGYITPTFSDKNHIIILSTLISKGYKVNPITTNPIDINEKNQLSNFIEEITNNKISLIKEVDNSYEAFILISFNKKEDINALLKYDCIPKISFYMSDNDKSSIMEYTRGIIELLNLINNKNEKEKILYKNNIR